MSKAPDAGCYRNRGHEEERHEDKEPEVISSPRHTVTNQHFKHQQQDVEPYSDQHGFEFYTRLSFSPEKRHKNHFILTELTYTGNKTHYSYTTVYVRIIIPMK